MFHCHRAVSSSPNVHRVAQVRDRSCKTRPPQTAETMSRDGSTGHRACTSRTSAAVTARRRLRIPIAAPLERCAELLGVDLATIREAAANVEPYVRADGTRIWSLMQLEHQLRPEVYRRRRGGYLDRRRTLATDG
jgi:hypothetical protein